MQSLRHLSNAGEIEIKLKAIYEELETMHDQRKEIEFKT